MLIRLLVEIINIIQEEICEMLKNPFSDRRNKFTWFSRALKSVLNILDTFPYVFKVGD